MKVHSKACPSFDSKNIHIQESLDGVSEAKSNSISLDVYSTKFKNCRYIYPHRIIRPIRKEYIDNQEQLRKVLSDLHYSDIEIDEMIGDNPKRAFLRYCLNSNALFPCEYCFAKGVKHTVKTPISEGKTDSAIIDKLKLLKKETKNEENEATIKVLETLLLDIKKKSNSKKRQITAWPPSTSDKELRTKENMLEIVALIEENQLNDDGEPLSKDEVKGVVGRSEFLKLDYFDFVNGLPPEYMHLVCLGVVKRLTELTFNVGLNRPRITKRKLSSTKTFNYLMSLTKGVFEFSRRSRDLDFAVYKAEEFRNLILFYFPHVLECIESDANERAVWLYLAFMIRACTLPDCEYFNVNVNHISTACQKFYKMYEQLFGTANCTYSTHVLCCHLLLLRQLGPLTETSAFKFESFYGEIRNSFTPGSPSTLKQIFETTILKRVLCPHSCEKSTQISNYDTSLQCNSLVYTYTNDNVNIYKVLDMIDDDVICHPQGKFNCNFIETPELDWNSVGVFLKGASSKEIMKVPQKSIAGKVLKVGEHLITCPDNVLKEK